MGSSMRRNSLYILSVVLVSLLIITGVYVIYKAELRKTQMSYFLLIHLVQGCYRRGSNFNHPPILSEGQILLPFKSVKEYIDYIWFDKPCK